MRKDYKYEVGFSFLKQDEAIAFDLNDNIQDRLSTFIYSKRQEELGGTDGEMSFNAVFNKECRIVVVLYRNGWGQTPWTRIEETAIKNRAFDQGWDFLIIVNLDSGSTLPNWVPKTHIWLDYYRFKTQGAIAVIEHKVKEVGGSINPSTIKDRAERLKRQRAMKKQKNDFLSGPNAVLAAQQEIVGVITKLKEIKTQIEDPTTFMHLGTGERQNAMYEFGFNGYFLAFNLCVPFESGIVEGKLRVALYNKEEHQYFGNEVDSYIAEQQEYRFDRDLIGNNGWSDYQTGENFMTSDELIDKWVKTFISDISSKN